MAWEVEYTDEFESWWVGLNEEEQIDIDAVVGLLEAKGPYLPYPYSSDIKGASYGVLRELRVSAKASPIESSMPLILAEQPFCLFAAGRPEGKAGMKNMSH